MWGCPVLRLESQTGPRWARGFVGRLWKLRYSLKDEGAIKLSRQLSIGMVIAIGSVACRGVSMPEMSEASTKLELEPAALASTMPIFQVDPLWPKPLPKDWMFGNVVAVAVDSQHRRQDDGTAPGRSGIDRYRTWTFPVTRSSECYL